MISARFSIQLLLAFTLLAGCGAPTGESSQPQLDKRDLPGVTNFTSLSQSSGFAGKKVGFGGTTTPAALAELKAEGFATVINLRLSAERDAAVELSQGAARDAGLRYVHLPFNPADASPEIVDAFLAAAGDAANQPVYIHCSSATRVAALWMTARVLVDEWSTESAEEEAVAIAGRPEHAVALANSLIASRQP